MSLNVHLDVRWRTDRNGDWRSSGPTVPCSGSARRPLRPTLFRGTLRAVQVERGIHQRHVGERLREVADLPPQTGIVLLGEEADVVAQREQPLEQRARVV